MTPARLRELRALAEAKKARDLARLDVLLAEDRASAEASRTLAATHAQDMAEGAGAAPLALLGRRLAWADAHMAAIRAGRAQLAAEIVRARAEATVSLGKHRALEHLLEGAEAELRAVQETRAERDAPPRI